MVRRTDDTLRCSFCGKSQNEVKKLIAGPTVYICNECIDICNEIITDDQQAESVATRPPLPKPGEIKNFLDEYVIGQDETKKRLAGRRLSTLQTNRTRPPSFRRRDPESKHSSDRSDRNRQDAAGANARAHARSSLHHRRRHDAYGSRLRRGRRREHHSKTAA